MTGQEREAILSALRQIEQARAAHVESFIATRERRGELRVVVRGSLDTASETLAGLIEASDD